MTNPPQVCMATFSASLIALLFPLMTLVSTPSIAAPTSEQLARFYEAPDVMALNGCIHYFPSLVPVLKVRLAAALQRGADKRTTVKALLAEYDDVARAMCTEISNAYAANPAFVARYYRTATRFSGGTLPGSIDAPDAQQWSADNAAFSRKSAHIPALFYLSLALGREFIDWQIGDVDKEDRAQLRQVESESRQCGAGDERKLIYSLAHDRGFASLLPGRYDLPALAREEARLRQTCLHLGLAYEFSKAPAVRLVEEEYGPEEAARSLAFVLKLNATYERYKNTLVKQDG